MTTTEHARAEVGISAKTNMRIEIESLVAHDLLVTFTWLLRIKAAGVFCLPMSPLCPRGSALDECWGVWVLLAVEEVWNRGMLCCRSTAVTCCFPLCSFSGGSCHRHPHG